MNHTTARDQPAHRLVRSGAADLDADIGTQLTPCAQALAHAVTENVMLSTDQMVFDVLYGVKTPSAPMTACPNPLFDTPDTTIAAGGRNPAGRVNAPVLIVPSFMVPRNSTTSPTFGYWTAEKPPP